MVFADDIYAIWNNPCGAKDGWTRRQVCPNHRTSFYKAIILERDQGVTFGLARTRMHQLLGVIWTNIIDTENYMLYSYCSVFDVDDERNPEEKKNGFVFDDPNEGVSILEEILMFSSACIFYCR